MLTLQKLLILGIVSLFVLGTFFPIPQEVIDKEFSNQQIALELEGELQRLTSKMDEIHNILSEYEGYKQPPPFTFAKYKQTYSQEQIREYLERGWVKTGEFGWPILKQKIREVLPPWIDNFYKEIENKKKEFDGNIIPADTLSLLTKKEEEINDFIKVQKHYIERTKEWDEWSKKGPWLLEDSPPKKLEKEIRIIEDFLKSANEIQTLLKDFFPNILSGYTMNNESLSKCLEAKKIVFEWYHGFTPQNKDIMKVNLTGNGYQFNVKACFIDLNENDIMIFKNGVEKYWKGIVMGIPFQTYLEIQSISSSSLLPEECIKITTKETAEKIKATSIFILPYPYDEETAAHEFGHTIGFRDRYRDVYNFKTQTYESYQWDIFSIMSSQSGPNPIVSEDDLFTLIKFYIVESWQIPNMLTSLK